MTASSLPRRPQTCLSDFALDEVVAARSLHAQPAPESVAHLETCSRCAERLAEFEAVEAPSLAAPPPLAKRGAPRSLVALSCATLAILLLSGLAVLRSHELPIARNASTSATDLGTRTKGALSLVVILRDSSGNVRRIAPGDVVHPGESLRFELTAAQAGYAGVVGLDAAGAATVYAPAQGSLTSLMSGAPVALPNTIVTDETLGTERLVAVLCSSPHPVQELKASGERSLLAAGGDPTHVNRLELPCEQAVVDLRKQPLQ